MNRIFIVEDDTAVCGELCRLLKSAGYETATPLSFERTVPEILACAPQLVLLDINLPIISGEMILCELRRKSDVPVIMVTAASGSDEVISLGCGADDYITKPYDPSVLLLRIAAVLRRAGKLPMCEKWRDLAVDTAKGSLTRENTEIILTKNEMLIFRQLLSKQGKIVTRDELMTALWDSDEFLGDNALTVNISRLRAKLAEAGYNDAVETRKKQGYILK